MFLNTSNVCQFEGRIAKDPQFQQLQGPQGPFEKVTFDIAVDRGLSAAQRQEAQNNNKPTADFIHCSLTGNAVNNFRQYYGKGKAIRVVCHYSQYQYVDKQTGQTQYGHNFEVDGFGFTVRDASNVAQGNDQQQGGFQNNGYQQPQQNYQNNGYQQQGGGYPQQQQQVQGNFQMFDNSNTSSPF